MMTNLRNPCDCNEPGFYHERGSVLCKHVQDESPRAEASRPLELAPIRRRAAGSKPLVDNNVFSYVQQLERDRDDLLAIIDQRADHSSAEFPRAPDADALPAFEVESCSWGESPLAATKPVDALDAPNVPEGRLTLKRAAANAAIALRALFDFAGQTLGDRLRAMASIAIKDLDDALEAFVRESSKPPAPPADPLAVSLEAARKVVEAHQGAEPIRFGHEHAEAVYRVAKVFEDRYLSGRLVPSIGFSRGRLELAALAVSAVDVDGFKGNLADLIQTLRSAFPHFADSSDPITAEKIAALGIEYFDMITHWTPATKEIDFLDQDGKARKLVWEDADDDGKEGWGIADEGYVVLDDARFFALNNLAEATKQRGGIVYAPTDSQRYAASFAGALLETLYDVERSRDRFSRDQLELIDQTAERLRNAFGSKQ